MTENKPGPDQLNRRREEIIEQLNRLQGDLRMELDHDPEEQAIQIEHEEVPRSLEMNLRRELAAIEDQLLDTE